MTREPKLVNVEKIVSSINAGGKTGYSHTKNKIGLLPISLKKLTCNGLKPLGKVLVLRDWVKKTKGLRSTS